MRHRPGRDGRSSVSGAVPGNHQGLRDGCEEMTGLPTPGTIAWTLITPARKTCSDVTQGWISPVIRTLLAGRYVAFIAVVVLLVALALWGRRVSYEQSINSFFAEDDPYMRVYQQAAKTFGDDNFVFVAYDDPELLTPRGWTASRSWPRPSDMIAIEGVQRVESLDAMPLLWAVDDTLLMLDRLPDFLRKRALETAKSTIKNIDLKTNAMTVRGRSGLRHESGGPVGTEGSPDTTSAVPRDR